MNLGQIFIGSHGTAQEVLIDPVDYPRPDMAATVAYWFITAPGQSIAWDKYGLAVYHLRDIPGVKPAVKDYAAITHELTLCALSPDGNPDPMNMQSWHALRPINLCMQLELPSDDAARTLAELAARAVVDGHLWAEPPLSGMKEPWRSSMIQTAAHLRGEPHAGA